MELIAASRAEGGLCFHQGVGEWVVDLNRKFHYFFEPLLKVTLSVTPIRMFLSILTFAGTFIVTLDLSLSTFCFTVIMTCNPILITYWRIHTWTVTS